MTKISFLKKSLLFKKIEIFQLNGNENVEKNVLSTVNALLLMNKKDTISKKLSGGMKRKLSIGIALVGDSKVVE